MEISKARAAIMIEQQYQEMEVWYPYYRLKEAGLDEVVLVGPESGETYPSKTGYPAKAELQTRKALEMTWDVLIIPGGFAPDFMRRRAESTLFVRKVHNSGAIVGAICHGGWMLASAELIDGVNVTSFFAIKDDMVHAGGNWSDKEVVVDRRIVTSRKPDDLPAFMAAILKELDLK